jgi:hypothetical protein
MMRSLSKSRRIRPVDHGGERGRWKIEVGEGGASSTMYRSIGRGGQICRLEFTCRGERR